VGGAPIARRRPRGALEAAPPPLRTDDAARALGDDDGRVPGRAATASIARTTARRGGVDGMATRPDGAADGRRGRDGGWLVHANLSF
jgi:hypothetical protein